MRCRRSRSITPSAAVWPPVWPWVASRVEAYDNARQARRFWARRAGDQLTSGSMERSWPGPAKVAQRERWEAEMGRSQQVLAAQSRSRARFLPRGPRLQGSEFTWAVAFVVPYAAVFFAFAVYPIGYGLWMGSDP